MHAKRHPPFRNRLLSLTPKSEFEKIETSMEHVELQQGAVVIAANSDISYVYFLCEGIASVLTVTSEVQSAQAGMCGREGFSPTSAGVGGTLSIHEVVMQVGGYGYRLPVEVLQNALSQCPVFANLLARYIQTFSTQISYTSLCNANYQVDARLARWLLMCHDRVDGDEISLTHDFISFMLSVRRPSVTTALHVLEGNKLVRAERARITIRDRRGLEQFAGDAYGKPEEEYRQLIGSFDR